MGWTHNLLIMSRCKDPLERAEVLSGVKAVHPLSRLNRAHPKMHDVFVLDSMNDADTIQESFALPHYDDR